MDVDGSEAASPRVRVDLLEAGDPNFVEALRAVSDPEVLARFASDWWGDPRPESRQLLFAYLDRVPDVPGHEGLIKRLFKLAEAAHDDAIMARFLVLADRLIRRKRRIEYRFERQAFAKIEEAQAQQADWVEQGWIQVEIDEGDLRTGPKRYVVVGHRPRPIVSTRGTTLARGEEATGDAKVRDQTRLRPFSVATRRYLQRRAWRYFRTLGRTDPARFVASASLALGLYRDSDLKDGSSLLDRFGLVHLLFGRSPALRLRSSGWALALGRTLSELAPAPSFPAIWLDHPEAVLQVLAEASSAVVARWAIRWIEVDRERFLKMGSATVWVNLLDRRDPKVVAVAVAMLDGLGDRWRGEIAPGRWVNALEQVSPDNRDVVAALLARRVRPDEVARLDAVRLAVSRPEPLARLGWSWLEGQGMVTDRGDSDAAALLGLLDAECSTLRPAILRGVREALASRPTVRSDWVWALLDSRHADVRAAGWAWFASEKSFWSDPELWARLVESSHLDILGRIASSTAPPVAIDPGRLGVAWASVLLAPHGLARVKPGVIRQVVARLEAIAADQVEEVDALLSLVAAVTRSARAPERRSALAALVGLADRRPEWSARLGAPADSGVQLGEAQ